MKRNFTEYNDIDNDIDSDNDIYDAYFEKDFNAFDFTYDIENSFIDYFLNVFDQENRESIKEIDILDSSDLNLYILGDTEGSVCMLYEWFLDKNLIDDDLKWIGRHNDYVIQMGDQIDNKRVFDMAERDNNHLLFNNINQYPDVYVLLFMEYMNFVSGGHVLNIIGNHEWFNVKHYFTFVYDVDGKNLNDHQKIERINQFSWFGICGKILRRRNFIIRINNCIFCHAGINPIHIEKYKNIMSEYLFNINEFITNINEEVNEPTNWVGETTQLFDYIIEGTKHSCQPDINGIKSPDGIMWSRFYFELVNSTNSICEFITNYEKKCPLNFWKKNMISGKNNDICIKSLRNTDLDNYIIVTGHNKSHNIWYCDRKMDGIYCRSDNFENQNDNIRIIDTDSNQIYYNKMLNGFIQYKNYDVNAPIEYNYSRKNIVIHKTEILEIQDIIFCPLDYEFKILKYFDNANIYRI
jgi:hypothetical protein